MPDSVIHADRLTKRYGRLTAVDAASLEVPRGCVLSLMGRNGAGKSSLIRMLLGLTPMSSGAGTVLGLNSDRDGVAIRRRVGYVPEAHHMYPWMRLDELLRFTSAFYPTWSDARCAELLRRFGLDPKKRVKELSRGMLAKLALTQALAHEPELLVLDEPTSGLDAVVRKEFLEEIVQVAADEGRTIFFSSHILSDVERVADTVALMEEGRISFVEPLERLKGRVRELAISFSGDAPERLSPPGAVSCRRSGREWVTVTSAFCEGYAEKLQRELPAGATVRVREMDLEEIFIALTGRPAEEADRAA